MQSKKATVEEASPSPPPLPNEPLPTPSASASGSTSAQETLPIDEPITSLGDGDEDEDDQDKEDEGGSDQDEWDPSEERLPGDAQPKSKRRKVMDKGKGKEVDGAQAGGEQPWQAVWAAEQNAWYFWNSQTGQVTWTNPLDPTPTSTSDPTTISSSDTAAQKTTTTQDPDPNVTPLNPPLPNEPPPLPVSSSTYTPHLVNPGQIPEIDPDLAYLLPMSQRGGAPGGDGAVQTAAFNARTGRFAPADTSYTYDHLDEYNRMKRMSSHYFDVEAWEKQRQEEQAKRRREEAEGVAPKKITRKDMERFRKKKAEQKHRSQAWLRD